MNNNTKNVKTIEKENAEGSNISNLLVGYARLSKAGRAIKISINTHAFGDCHAYMTNDGQSYVPLVISLRALRKVMDGDRVVTTISQLLRE